MEDLKPWRELTEADIDRIRRTKCIYCKYSAGEDDRTKIKWLRRTICEYILITKKRRGVRPELCEHWKD